MKITDPVLIDTPRVKIRPLDTVAWERVADGILYEGSFHARFWGIKTAEDVRRMCEARITAWKSGRGNPLVFLDREEKEVLGISNFMNEEPVNKMVEIGGTWISKRWVRSFVNTETKLALLEHCFGPLGLQRVEFRVDAENAVSRRAVERLGAHLDGVLPRRKINANGDPRDYAFYSVTDLTWPEVRATIRGKLRGE